MSREEAVRQFNKAIEERGLSPKEWFGYAVHNGNDQTDISRKRADEYLDSPENLDIIELVEGSIGCQIILGLK